MAAASGYAVSIEARGGAGGGAAAAKDMGAGAVASRCRDSGCGHAAVVGPAFQDGGSSPLHRLVKDAGGGGGGRATITAIDTADPALLVRLRPIKQIGPADIRGLFRRCTTPEDSAAWIDKVAKRDAERPPYRRIVEAIDEYQMDLAAGLCRTMAPMSGNTVWAHGDRAELDQGAEGAEGAIEASLRKCERGPPGGEEAGGARAGGEDGRRA